MFCLYVVLGSSSDHVYSLSEPVLMNCVVLFMFLSVIIIIFCLFLSTCDYLFCLKLFLPSVIYTCIQTEPLPVYDNTLCLVVYKLLSCQGCMICTHKVACKTAIQATELTFSGIGQ